LHYSHESFLFFEVPVYPPEEEHSEKVLAPTPEERELLSAAIDVIRARTLSILRRFEDDGDRKTSVLRFLIEAEVISKAKLNLSVANLSGADLSFANLSGADLSGADLSGAELIVTSLRGVKLRFANLNSAKLCSADLSGADLSGAKLRGADFRGADLRDVIWDIQTQWPNPKEVAKAKNIPEKLKQQLRIMGEVE
jgi:hypothetical protein